LRALIDEHRLQVAKLEKVTKKNGSYEVSEGPKRARQEALESGFALDHIDTDRLKLQQQDATRPAETRAAPQLPDKSYAT
jgi:hypothetical protein